MIREKVLFVCVHNSVRSQMAEALLNHLAGDRFEAESAGLEPGTMDPLTIAAMKDMNIDISRNHTRSVFDLHKSGARYTHVITLCDETAAKRCPTFTGVAHRINWIFTDPSARAESDEERLQQTIEIRDRIRKRIEAWVMERTAPTSAELH